MIYIAGPLTHVDPDVQADNIHRAARAYLTLVDAGIPAICPHLSAYIPGAFDLPYGKWIEAGCAQLHAAKAIWLLPGWEHSRGTLVEYHVARALNLPVYRSLAMVLAVQKGLGRDDTPVPASYFDDAEYAAWKPDTVIGRGRQR